MLLLDYLNVTTVKEAKKKLYLLSMGDSHVLGISEFLQTPPGLTVDRVSIVI